jgi:hypothetical protein
MSIIELKYMERCVVPSDINEHLPTLYMYASNCTHITETGVRTAVSSYAFAKGLIGRRNGKLIQVDCVSHPNILSFQQECGAEGIQSVFYEQSDLDCPLEMTELLFIDTWHVYGHLKRELARWNTYVSKYIILHDTTVDEYYGETIRLGWNAEEQSKNTGIPVFEINMGLWPAIVEFLSTHPEWVLEKRYTNNNGLTILRRLNNL